jgi:hypothetical protein
MATKLKRYMVSMDAKMQERLERDAAVNRRGVANQIMFILDLYYLTLEKQSEIFLGNQEPQGEKGGNIPVYRSSPPAPARPSAERVNSRPNKT